MKNPQTLARSHVVPANVTLDVLLASRNPSAPVGRPYNHDIARHDRRRMQADLSRDQVDGLIVLGFQIDQAVLSETGNWPTGLRIERTQHVARRDIEDALVLPVGPVPESPTGQLARRLLSALPFVEAVDPAQLAGRGIQCKDRASRPACRVQHPARHQRRRLVGEFLSRPEVVRFETPRHLQLAEIAGVDLIESRVTGIPQVSAVGGPLTLRGAVLCLDGCRRSEQKQCQHAASCPTTNRSHRRSPAHFSRPVHVSSR